MLIVELSTRLIFKSDLMNAVLIACGEKPENRSVDYLQKN